MFFRCPRCRAPGHLRIATKFANEAAWEAAVQPKKDRDGTPMLRCLRCFRLTPTQLAVLKLIEQQRHLGEYVPAYEGKRGRGAFPNTIALRAAHQLDEDKGYVRQDPDSPSGYVLTPDGEERVKQT